MLKMLFETGHPWITFKDPCNVRSPQDHAGVDPLEQPLHRDHAEHRAATRPRSATSARSCSTSTSRPTASSTTRKLRETVRIAVRALDNVIDVNFYPTEPARTANQRHRPVGLGVMGLQYALYREGPRVRVARRRVEFCDEAMEAIAYYAYEAVERPRGRARRATRPTRARSGTAACCRRTRWTCSRHERGEAIDVPRGGELDWAPLRAKIAAQGMRNSNVLAIAPTATIANIMGTSPCIEPIYKNLFAKSNLSGDFMVLNPFLVARPQGRAGCGTARWRSELKARRRRRSSAIDGGAGGAARALPDGVRDRARVADRRRRAPRRSGSTSRSR